MKSMETVSMLDLPDVAAFIALVNHIEQHPFPQVRNLFDPHGMVHFSRAPGRLDVMGGIADYSGSLVLQLPLQEATIVAVQRAPDQEIHIVSLGKDFASVFQTSLDVLAPLGNSITYDEAREYFQRNPDDHWAAYVAGAFPVLMRELGAQFRTGVRILIASRVPQGKGVSSSAALEVAAMQAIAAAFDVDIAPRQLALLCQTVENHVVGAPCGVMDQMTSACGEQGRLLALLCQPAELLGMIDLPEEIAVWGLDSGERHFVSGADYGQVRVGAFMGYRIIAELAGLPVSRMDTGQRVAIVDPRWRGYLANVTPSEFEQFFAQELPLRLTGQDFLDRYTGTHDSVTQVDPARTYAVRVPTAHPIYEHFRVRVFAELLNNPNSERKLDLLGELMYQSHASYSACGLGSPGTDRLVQLVRDAGAAQGLYGAKITGGGSGGTVAVLGRSDAHPAIRSIATRYAEETGYFPAVFSGSSPGACTFGAVQIGLARNEG
jgi:L-arabinokinase